MVAYNFKSQFADLVRQGEKCQTIRATGKRRHAQVGDRLQLYTGMRTKSCKKLADAICLGSSSIQMRMSGVGLLIFENYYLLTLHEMVELARADGFTEDPLNEFIQFFGPRMPFSGVLITWARL
ncbi:MAG: ASCH domain-containing protein [Cyanobacteria bacterium P01_C01_bin.120]